MATLVSLSEYKSFLNILSTDTTLDNDLEDLTEEIEESVQEFLGRRLMSDTYTEEVYCGTGLKSLTLKQFPVTSVSSIKQYEYEEEDIWTTLDADDYEEIWIVDECKIVLQDMIFEEGYNNFKITYDAGYTTLPYSIKIALKKLLRLYFDESGLKGSNGTLGIINKVKEGVQVLLDKEAAQKIFNGLEGYRNFNV